MYMFMSAACWLPMSLAKAGMMVSPKSYSYHDVICNYMQDIS
jgi:hypothetical protein